MIKFEIDNERHSIEADGDITTLQVEIAVLVRQIYGEIKNVSEEGAHIFLGGLVRSLLDPTSPLFEEVTNEQE